MPASSFFVTPDVDMTRETALRDGEIITRANPASAGTAPKASI